MVEEVSACIVFAGNNARVDVGNGEYGIEL
jgi:hypothetical protein